MLLRDRSLAFEGLARTFPESDYRREPDLARLEARRLKVAVLVDLEDGPGAGGHVKFWHNVAQAAARSEPAVDLTVYVQGPRSGATALAEHVRLVSLPPLLSSRRLGFIRCAPDHSDLAPFHPRLALRLSGHDVVHTTDAYFAYARTAEWLSCRAGARLVTSVHTDTPAYTRIYAARLFEQLFGTGWLGRRILHDWTLPDRLEARMHRRFARHLRHCRHVWISPKQSPAGSEPPLMHPSASILRRGIDKQTFSPGRRNRRRLAERLGIPTSAEVLAFAGRVDSAKGVMVLAEAARRLIAAGRPIHVLCAGAGLDEAAVRRCLGAQVHLPGVVAQEELGWMLASADLFVFPSEVEIAPNVVLEAQAAGLAALVAPAGGGLYVERNGHDGVVVADPDPTAWARAIEDLLDAPERIRAIGAAARRRIDRRHPSWSDVLQQDLLPGWRKARAADRPADAREREHVWRAHSGSYSPSR